MYKNLFLLCLIIISTSTQAQNTTEKLDSFLTLLEKHDKFMGSVAIREGADLMYSHAIGWASVKDSIPNKTDTKFRIGSVSKIFTASLIFQMIEEKALSLNTPLSRFFPEIPNADSITIDHLLAHRSGIHNITSDADYMTYMITGSTKKEMIERIVEKGSDFKAGSKAKYSNSNYILLGYILEALTDQSYAKILQNRICEPLKLRDTYYEDSTEIMKNENYSYRYTGKRWFRAPETHMSVPHGAGAIVSTSKDLTSFIHALFNQEVVSKRSLNRMTEIRDGIGRGLFKYVQEVDTAYGHGGSIDAFYTQLFYYPNRDLSIGLCTNGLNYRDEKILEGLTNIYFGRSFQMPQFMDAEDFPDSAALKAYTGYYSCENYPLDIKLFIKQNQIYGQATGQSSIALGWESEDVLTLPAANIVIDFTEAEKVNGHLQSFIFSQGGPEFKFFRKQEQ